MSLGNTLAFLSSAFGFLVRPGAGSARMRRLRAQAAGLAVGALSGLFGLTPLLAEGLPSDAAALEWLAGRWLGTVEGARGVSRFEAHYTTPQGGAVLGMSKSFGEGDRLLWFEFERFEVREGVLSVTPYPNGRPSVTFKLKSYDAAAKKAVFANPEHDFPTEISYQRVADDRVQLVVSGPTQAGSSSVMVFDLSRQP